MTCHPIFYAHGAEMPLATPLTQGNALPVNALSLAPNPAVSP